jgi:hypothetical protein
VSDKHVFHGTKQQIHERFRQNCRLLTARLTRDPQYLQGS